MSLDVFIGIAGGVITVLVVAAMILIAPRGAVPDRAYEEPPPRDAALGLDAVERAAR
jgi:hypothetical protein